MFGIDPPQQLPFVESETHGVIRLPGARLPRRLLAREDDGEPIEIGDDAAIDRLVDRKQSGLVREELADGDAFLAVLAEFRPVGADALLVIEPAARMRNRKRHRRKAFRRRMDDDHGVALPWFAGVLVADTAPEIDYTATV
jgi:hypothetical protein